MPVNKRTKTLVDLVAGSDVSPLDCGLVWQIHARRPRPDWRHFERCDDAVMHLKESPLRGHQILIKGSRSIGLERLMPNL